MLLRVTSEIERKSCTPCLPVIGLAVRWYLRYRLRYADVVEWLAERHIRVDASTVFDWVQKFSPLYQDAGKRIGTGWVSAGWSMRPTSK